MKLLVVSDSHNNNDLLRKIATKHNDCDYYIHCGDSQSSKEEIHPFVSVKGNCDYFSSDYPKNMILTSPLGKVYIEHIPFYQTYISELKRKGFVLYIHGHTHVKRDEVRDGIRIINPGCLAYPRGEGLSYCVINITKKIDVKFYELEE